MHMVYKTSMPDKKIHCPPILAYSIFSLLVVLLGFNVYIFADDASHGPNQLALLTVGILTLAIGSFYFKLSYYEMEQKIIHSIKSALPACFILLMVGPLISLWILGGIVPGIIYYGLEMINPIVFLPVACIACAMVSVSIGSSWSTMGTIGIALLGIGEALSVPIGMTAGAIISGAYFGDKLSPLSDTTNLAPAIAGTDLFTHIRYLMYTTVPAIGLSVIIFSLLGFFQASNSNISVEEIRHMQEVLKTNFHISPLVFVTPIIVLILVAKKTPPLPALFVGVLGGIFSALILQNNLISSMGAHSLQSIYELIVTVAHKGTEINFGHEQIDGLLSRGGMYGMLTTVWLILSAMFFGGALESTRMIDVLAKSFLKSVKGAGSLVGSTIGACITLNMTASDQYLAIVVPGKMFKKRYEEYELAEQNLSRALEDGATMTSVLIPWNTCGAYASGVLGVSPIIYAPYCFFNYLSPAFSIFLAAANIKIAKKVTKILKN